MRSLLVIAVAVLWSKNVESTVQDCASSTPAFVNGAAVCGQVSRKRPRGAPRVLASSGVPATATAGSFTAARLACEESAWFGVAGEGRRRSMRGESLLLQLWSERDVFVQALSTARAFLRAISTRHPREARGIYTSHSLCATSRARRRSFP